VFYPFSSDEKVEFLARTSMLKDDIKNYRALEKYLVLFDLGRGCILSLFTVCF